MIQHHFDNDKGDDRAGDDSPALSVLNYVLLTVRTWDVRAIEKRKRTEAAAVRHAYPGLLSRLDAVLDMVRMDCQSTQDAIDHARELAAVIEEYTKNPAAEQKEEPGSCGSATPDKEGEAGNDCAAQSEEAGCTDSASQAKESASSDSQAESPRPQRTARTTAQKQLADMLNASEAELPRHPGQRIAEILNVGRVSPHQQGLSVARTGYKHTGFLPEEGTHGKHQEQNRPVHPAARRVAGHHPAALRHGQAGQAQSATAVCPVRQQSPHLSQMGEKIRTATAVHLLLDCSGSMSGARMELASRACYAVALALEQCRGVNVGVTAFPGNDAKLEVTVAPILRHGERMHHKFSMPGTGYTPLGEALW